MGLRQDLPGAVEQEEYAAFHLSDCIEDTVPLMRLRNVLAKNIFPLTGVPHSLSYERFMSAYLKLLWPGTCGRDALVATSRSTAGHACCDL